ncbi:MAG: hypothetical protein HY936_06385 [Nitrosomonadales bacterium]|nr:hypothetical protein [Nitrosomonadales bacterium]
MGCSPTLASPCSGGSSGGGSGGGYSAPSYDYGAARRAQEAAEAEAAAERQRQQAEAERAERERQAEEKRQAEIKRQKDAAFIRDRDAAANSLKGSTGSAMSQLKGLAGTDDSGLKGSGFDTGNSGLKGLRGSDPVVDNRNEPAGLGGQSNFKGAIAKPGKPAPHTDTSVVDARNVPRDGAHLTDQVPELKNSPAADRITKGFQAVINHDWPVALAWWQDALIRDPNNAALKRSVDLAQWMVDRPKTTAAGPATPLGAAIYSASHGDSAKAIRQFELVKKENPAIAPQVDSMIDELRQRQKKESPAHKNSIEVEKQIAEWDRQWVEKLHEDGMNMLSIGDEKQAQWIFHFADSVSQKKYARPLAAPKVGKTK